MMNRWLLAVSVCICISIPLMAWHPLFLTYTVMWLIVASPIYAVTALVLRRYRRFLERAAREGPQHTT